MIEIKSLASSSSGNAHLVTDGHFEILLDCGISWRLIKQKLNFQTSQIAGCLLGHAHGDHSKAWKDVAKAGIDAYMSQGTIDALGASGHRIKPIKARQIFQIGNWSIMPLDAHHDAPEPLIFVLTNSAGERLLYATDTFYIKERIPGLTHLMLEVNYSLDILNENVKNGTVPLVQKNRILQSHFSLENVKKFLKANDLSQVRSIHLIHLSDQNSSAERFKREIQSLTGKPVVIADK